MEAILMSIRPQHLVNILNGKKTRELRIRIPKGFKGWIYFYCTKGKPYLYKNKGIWFVSYENLNTPLLDIDFRHNGKVVCRFRFDEYKYFDSNYEDFIYSVGKPQDCSISYDKNWLSIEKFEKLAIKEGCLNVEELWDYFPSGVNDVGYALHIKQLEIFDKPKELGEFYNPNKCCHYFNNQCYAGVEGQDLNCESCKNSVITKAPQSWQYIKVEE